MARALAADPPVMLMDEPFGAVDPIVRARLQDQFLDIQTRLRKTIVFVTHDIDEAIKMADRIAILNVGGILEQYATPEEILRAPANDFVERFVGAERGPEAPGADQGGRHRGRGRPGRRAGRAGSRRRRRQMELRARLGQRRRRRRAARLGRSSEPWRARRPVGDAHAQAVQRLRHRGARSARRSTRS